uniref:NADH dehydrogenase subunit 6 n=1 Tax=Nuttalliella namaqua TaxID=1029659 RepID=A0A1P8AGH3_9ACAR|nr:NADH dehydrogenase subunit 6 [Nuttalliella namaqua]UYB78181.1 NADH dehydrogenase subunit 6 [Nuttalliella namaqua]
MNLLILIPILFMLSFHPLMMIILIILLSIIIAFMTFKMMNFSLPPFMLLLLILGGMLMIFSYFISLTSNQKFLFNKKSLFFLPLLLTMNISNLPIYHNNMKSFLLMVSKKFMFIFILMLLFLLITLMATTKIFKSIKSPLRSN